MEGAKPTVLPLRAMPKVTELQRFLRDFVALSKFEHNDKSAAREINGLVFFGVSSPPCFQSYVFLW